VPKLLPVILIASKLKNTDIAAAKASIFNATGGKKNQ